MLVYSYHAMLYRVSHYCLVVRNADSFFFFFFLLLTNKIDLWDSPPDPNQRGEEEPISTRRKWIVLFWFVVLAASYAGERSTFKLLVDRAGPFRLFAVEMVTAVHAILLGVSMAVYALLTKQRQSSSRRRGGGGSGSNLRGNNNGSATSTSHRDDPPLGLGIPLVDVSLMALLDVVNLILVFLTGIYVPPTLTVILVQFLLPLTVFLTQFSHPDGKCTCCRDPSYQAAATAAMDSQAATTAAGALLGWGGLSANHLWGSLIIFMAVVLALVPAYISIANPEFFIYADTIPLRTAFNSLLFASACIPAAASQLYKEHVFLYYKQPVNLPLLNWVLSLFQFLFASVLSPLVFGLQGLGAKTNEDWATLYPSTSFSMNFVDGLRCFVWKMPDDEQENKYPEEAFCDLTLLLTFLHAFSIIAVGVAVDRIVHAGATKVMYRGISAGIILAVLCMMSYDMTLSEFSYGPFVDGLNCTCVLLLILGSEVYHRVSLQDSTFETVIQPMENLYETDD